MRTVSMHQFLILGRLVPLNPDVLVDLPFARRYAGMNIPSGFTSCFLLVELTKTSMPTAMSTTIILHIVMNAHLSDPSIVNPLASLSA